MATTTALTAVENKVPNISDLVKEPDFNIKISEIENKITTDHDHEKFITTQEFNKISSENFTARLKDKCNTNIASKSEITHFLKRQI